MNIDIALLTLDDLVIFTLSQLVTVVFHQSSVTSESQVVLPSTCLPVAEIEYIIALLTDAALKINTVEYNFEDAMNVISDIHQIQPKLDLTGVFNTAYQGFVGQVTGYPMFINLARVLNQHLISESGYASIDALLTALHFQVNSIWAAISAISGYPISADNIIQSS
jgi:hypothetical protein